VTLGGDSGSWCARSRRASRRHYRGALLVAVGALAKLSTLAGIAPQGVTVIAIDPRHGARATIDLALASVIASRSRALGGVWAFQHRGGFSA
jgi:hypothetical protein